MAQLRMTLNFMREGSPHLVGGQASSPRYLEPNEEERRAVYALTHAGHIPMAFYGHGFGYQEGTEQLHALVEQRGVGYIIGYARALKKFDPDFYAKVIADAPDNVLTEKYDQAEPLAIPPVQSFFLVEPLLKRTDFANMTINEMDCAITSRGGGKLTLKRYRCIAILQAVAFEMGRNAAIQGIKLHESRHFPIRLNDLPANI